MRGLLKDYIQGVKDYTPQGQNKTLWDQFFTNTTRQYQSLAQQTQDMYAYDISDAYANYKRQQLQLQMNQQLGSGFKQQAGEQLESQYGSTYANIKAKELGDVGAIKTQYDTALQQKESELSSLAERIQTYDTLIHEYASEVGLAMPKNAIQSTQLEDGTIEKTLTDYGRRWYHDVINKTTKTGENFQDWIMSDTYSGDLSETERKAALDAYSENADIFLSTVGGIGSGFDRKALDEKIAADERQLALDAAKETLANRGAEFRRIHGNYENADTEVINSLISNTNRVSNYITQIGTTTGIGGKRVTDVYGNQWEFETDNYVHSTGTGTTSKFAANVGKQLGIVENNGKINKNTQYHQGDVVYLNGKYYLISEISNKRFGVREVIHLGGRRH